MDTCHPPVTLAGGVPDGGLEAELDLASIDKVDVRNELRRYTMVGASERGRSQFGFLLQTEGLPDNY